MHRLVIFLTFVAVAHGRGRIVGGKDTEISKHNYQVSVEYLGSHWYGGVLIKPNTVITEACFIRYKEGYLTVRAGSSIIHEGGSILSVSKIYVHPKFPSDPSEDYNVAVLLLDGSFSLNQHIGVIELAPKGLSILQGTIGTVTGWGGRNKNEFRYKQLQYIEVPFVPWNLCDQYLPYPLYERMSCWGYLDEQKDVCNSDVGGPLVIQNAAGNPVLAAVVNYAIDCGKGGIMGYPGTYTDVTNSEIHEFLSKFL